MSFVLSVLAILAVAWAMVNAVVASELASNASDNDEARDATAVWHNAALWMIAGALLWGVAK